MLPYCWFGIPERFWLQRGNTRLVVHTTIPLDPAHRETAMDLVADLVEQSWTKDDTVRYRAMADLSEQNLIRFFEQYEGASAAEAHLETEAYRPRVWISAVIRRTGKHTL